MTRGSVGAAQSRVAIAAAGPAGSLYSSSGLKMFMLLIVALLPLGIVALIGSIGTIRSVDTQRVTALRLQVAQAANGMLGAINSDRSALRLLANALEADPRRTDICKRAAAQLGVGGTPVPFAVTDNAGRRLCSEGGIDPADGRERIVALEQIAALKPGQNSLVVRTASLNGTLNAIARYDAPMLAAMSGLSEIDRNYVSVALTGHGLTVPIINRGEAPPPERQDRIVVPLNLASIEIAAAVNRPPVTVQGLLATLLPILLWVAAAGIGWWTVNQFLLRPLVRLNRHVAAYEPGKPLGLLPQGGGPLREIGLLGQTFSEIADDVAEHEAQLAKALEQQRDLTREVHHRVKNNLQIIASLINLHSRSAESPDAAMAYATIQRRVDALSVVHRNHYASTELTMGVSARALVGELANALRASGPSEGGGGGFAIKVDVDNFYMSQDIAVPVAFLLTELVELAMLSDPAQPVCIALSGEGAKMIALRIESAAFRPSDRNASLLERRYGRVLTGLARQLRGPLEFDPGGGRYAILIATA